MTDEIEDAVVDAILTHDGPSGPASESYLRAVTAVARAVLAVPAIADALERDRKVAEIVAAGRFPGGVSIHATEAIRIAALYPEGESR